MSNRRMIEDIVADEVRDGLDDLFGKIRKEFDRNFIKKQRKLREFER